MRNRIKFLFICVFVFLQILFCLNVNAIEDSSYDEEFESEIDKDVESEQLVKVEDEINEQSTSDETGKSERMVNDVQSDDGQVIPDGVYSIQSVNSNDAVIDVEGGKAVDRANIQIYKEKAGRIQKFKIEYVGDGYYIIKMVYSNKVLDVFGGYREPGTNVILFDYHNGDGQKWRIIKNQDNTYSFVSKGSGLYLDLYGGYISDGTNVQVYTKNGSSAQKFIIRSSKKETGVQSVSDSSYRILSMKDINKSVEILNNNSLKLQSSNLSDVQRFKFVYDGDGYYKIKCNSGSLLTVANKNNGYKSNVIQETDQNIDEQKWIVKAKGNGIYKIISKKDGLCLSITNSNNGSNVILDEECQDYSQEFVLVDMKQYKNAEVIEDGIYQIGLKSGMVLDVYGAYYHNSSNIQIHNNNKTQNQKFRISRVDDTNYYKITAVHSNKSLDIYGGYNVPETNVQQFDSHNGTNQQWILKSVGNGYYNIISRDNGLCLDIYGGLINNPDANVQMYYLHNSEGQQFKLTPINIIDNGTYEIETKIDSNKILDVYGASNNEFSNIQIFQASNGNNQKFRFELISNNTYKIFAKHSNKAITVGENNNVYQATYNNSLSQQWEIVEAGENYYYLKSKLNGKVLDIERGSTANETNVEVWEQHGADWQKFRFVTGFRKFYEEGIYGQSGLAHAGDGRGSNLKYYKIGQGGKSIFLTFGIHGFEDSYSHDGSELTYMAEEFKNYLYNNITEDLVNKWTIYIFPNLNPDGQTHGWTNNGPGRTTLFSEAPGHKGIDMNRGWPSGFSSTTNSNRNYNGTAPLQAYEARHLRDFIVNHQGSSNILIDTHGWLNETIGDYGLGGYYRVNFGLPKHINSYGQGYLVNWARTLRNGRSVLVELPEVKSHSQVVSSGYVNKYINATMALLREN